MASSLVWHQGVLSVAGVQGVQNARACVAFTVSRLYPLPHLSRCAIPTRIAPLSSRIAVVRSVRVRFRSKSSSFAYSGRFLSIAHSKRRGVDRTGDDSKALRQ